MATDVDKPISEETIRRALGEFQIIPETKQVFYIQQYIRLLLRWNEKLNLTAIRDPLEILYRHFCESMFGASAIPVDKGRLADIGAGPGFPGIPLKLARPELAPLDFVCSRAVGDFQPFLEWATSPQVGAEQVALWIGGRDLEVVQKMKLWDWKAPVLIPKSLQRYILVGKKREMSAA